MTGRMAAFVLAVATAAPGAAQVLWIPAAAHVGGYAGTNWRTDVELRNPGGAPARVRIEAFARSASGADPVETSVTVPANAAVRLPDILASRFGMDGVAALRLTPLDGAVLATSRTYNETPDGTYGQFVPAVPETAAFGPGETAELIGLSQSASGDEGYRTNLGIVETSGCGTVVTVALHDASGTETGRFDQALGPYGSVQIDRVFRRGSPGAVEDGFITVTVGTDCGAVVPYASVVDNRTGDAILVPAQPRPATAGAIVADHEAADAFDAIPADRFDAIRERFGRILYGHTSHGSQIVTGLGMLEAEDGETWAMPSIDEISADLGHQGDLGWVDITRDRLGTDGAGYGMVVWSWCGGMSDNTPEGVQAYLDAMAALEADYPGIVFVYMTGHLDGTGPEGTLRRNNDQVRDWCRERGRVLFDFADIERWDPDGVEHPWDSDACEWCADWCAGHDCPDCGSCAHSHCFNCWRKGRAFWWLLDRAAASRPR